MDGYFSKVEMMSSGERGERDPSMENQLALEACGPYKGNFIEGKAKGNIDPVDAKRQLEDHLDGNGSPDTWKSRVWIQNLDSF